MPQEAVEAAPEETPVEAPTEPALEPAPAEPTAFNRVLQRAQFFISYVTGIPFAVAQETEESSPVVDAPAPEVPTTPSEPEAMPSEEVLPAEPAQPEVSAPTSVVEEETVVAESAESVVVVDGAVTRAITLADFSTLPLQPGQFVKNVQLRASLAGRSEVAADSLIPSLTFTAATPDATYTLGSVLIDGEVSNALNGGNFLFAFPYENDLAFLKNTSVTATFSGDVEALDGLYLDAVWLEIEIETITRADLMKRAQSDLVEKLKAPEAYELISEARDFTRFEGPVFNLRYVSQRNKAVQAVREFFGRDIVRVEDVAVKHHASGEIGVTPEVTVTREGLVTVRVPEAERRKLKPGVYEIEITVSEGGVEVVDSFEFQWGLLAINTDQTEYTLGSPVTVYAGALTPNGNTLCDATLRLFVVAPDGAITQSSVDPSGQCFGNNVTDTPDYLQTLTTTQTGMHELFMERIEPETGSVISHTSMSFSVVADAPLTIERNGPTRIYPPSGYPMELTVTATESFSGTLIERVPNTFSVTAGEATVDEVDGVLELSWPVSLSAGESMTVSYSFDAPDLSPFLYELGPARLESKRATRAATEASATDTATNANAGGNGNGNGGNSANSNGVGNGVEEPVQSTATASTSTETVTEPAVGESQAAPTRASATSGFVELRQWQIASDATGNMILYWDSATSIPSGWSCLSCGSGTFFQRFAMGSSTYNTTGGAATHTPTGTGSVLATSLANTESGAGTISPVAHTHTYTPTIASASNLPSYRQLRVIQYTASAGEPASIPTGAIGVFDVASSSLPAGWNRYAAQDGYYVRGEDTPGTTGGSNTHTHAITGTTGAAAGTNTRTRGTPTQVAGSSATHTHTVSTTTPSLNNEPPYIEVVFAKLTATATAPNNLITMWTEDVPGGWLDVSTANGAAFNQRFPKGAATYGATGGANTHVHGNMTGIVSSAPSATTNGVQASPGFGADGTHTHSVSVSSFSTTSQLPPYLTVVFGKRQGTDPVYEQLSSRWYVNTNAQTPTDAWPVGATDLAERDPIGTSTTLITNGQEVRLRLSTKVTNATSTAGTDFKLQFGAGFTCSAIGTWSDVGGTASTSIWRGFNNTSVTNGGTLSTTLLASTTVAETYEEDGVATTSPNALSVDDVGEWDFVLEHNGAAAGTNYCFRLVLQDGTPLNSYTHYPMVYTNRAPQDVVLDTPFNNEKVASTTRLFTFDATDPEGNDIHYEIEIDNDPDFSSPVEDKNTISNSTRFDNLIVPADKAAFNSGQTIQFTPTVTFTNGTTYWWRVRGQDPSGSNSWGSWSDSASFTVDTSLIAAAWFQTTEEQFDTSTLVGVQSIGSDAVNLITGSTTGTMTSDAIVFADGVDGTAWDSLVFSDTETTGDVKYTLQYLNDADIWTTIPDAALAGNSTGFDASPVSLLDLDTDTYDTLRIVATLTNSGGTPSIESWGINWGYRVETPVVASPFPNEKVGTTTPTFSFSTTDPQNDSLTYQISWSTDVTFTSSSTRTSGVASGFSNLDTGLDTDPFISGDTIQFKVQAADALTNGTTYWFRVRAKDTTGSNAYSFWTEPQSFTVDTAVVVSTWFQTTEEQFDTNVLSGVTTLGTDAVAVATTATEAILVYGEGTANIPRYRQWNGSSWGSEGALLDIGAPVSWARVKAGTTREEYVAITIGTDADVNAQVFQTGAWGDLQEMTTNVGSVAARGADVAYETLSGDAMVAYCDGDADPSYYIWNGSTWTSGGTINLASASNCEWIELASDPVSDEIIILSRDAAGNAYEAQVWNGSAWANSTTLGTIVDPGHSGMAVEYEESGGQAIILSSDGNPARFTYRTWNGTTWAAAATQAIGDDLEWASLVRDRGSDEMLLCYQDEDTNIGVVQWTGAAWTGQTELLATTGKSKTDPGFACVYENTSGRDNYALTTYTNTTQSVYTTWNNATWAGATQVNTIGDAITMLLERTGTNLILGIFFDETNDSLLFSSWNGTSWSTTETIENNASVGASPYGHPYDIAPRNPGREGTTIVSPGIDFTAGVGPYWEDFAWTDTTPGSSDIRYSVQYYDGDSWEFIPDGDLTGNAAGFTTSPVDLSALDKNTYNLIRPYAELTCDGSNNCPTLSDWTVRWAEGITISGTLDQYDQTTDVTSGTVNVAVNGVLQTGKSGTIAAGAWSIPNVTVFAGDIVSVFVSGANDANEAVGVTRYDGTGDITGLSMYERHVALGSNDATSTAMTNADVGAYTVTQDEDVFLGLTGSALNLCATTGCADVRLAIKAGTVYSLGGTLATHDFQNNGTFIATSTVSVSGSWDNNATTTMTGSTVIMTATSTTESIDTTGAAVASFNNLTFGTTTGAATFTLANTLDVNGALTVTRGTLARGVRAITVAGNLLTGANGFWTGNGTTTFDGTAASTWTDQNATKQNPGYVVVDGTNKSVTLGSNVVANSIRIGADDTLDASTSNYSLTVYGNFINTNTFQARSGTVVFAATTTNRVITAGGDAFYNLSFTGSGGSWSFTENTLSVSNDVSISAGTITMPTATTTIAGSFLNTGGTFAHNNSVIAFTGSGSRTLTLGGTAFTNAFYDVRFAGTGTYTFSETYATTSNDFRVVSGTVVLPSAELALGGSLLQTGGTITPGGGTVRFYSSGAESITLSSPLNSVLIAAAGPFTFTATNATLNGSLTVNAGSLTLPSGTLTLGGSLDNNATLVPQTGTVLFNSTSGSETIAVGSSSLYNATFNSTSGIWTVSESATTTNNTTLTAGTFTLASGRTLAVGATFSTALSNASTTWTGSTLSLLSGAYSINTKANGGDTYNTLLIASTADIKAWNSSAATVAVISGGSFYSQDHAAVDGTLNIYGAYERTTGTEYWSHATDFDGTALGGGARQANVRFASGASASFTGSTVEIVGISTASTTVANQGSGTYTVSLANSTINASYYQFADLGGSGLSLLSGVTVTDLDDGSFTVGAAAASALTIASSTIDANPGYQIFRTRFATTTAIGATNVTQTGGAPTSYWWFRSGTGNLYGEAYDADTGDPGSVRFDDSSLVITISGTVYSDAGVTPLAGGTCDGATNVVRVVVEGGATYNGTCSNVNGAYSIGGVVVVGDPTITVYLNDASGGQRATMVTKTPTANITDAHLYANRVIVRHEDVAAMTIADMNAFDTVNDSDVRYLAATSSGNTLTVLAGNELYVWPNKTFSPGGAVTVSGNGAVNSYDGSLFLGATSTFTGVGTTTYTIGGVFTQSAGASFIPASSTVIMNATSSGKAITAGAGATINFHNLSFTGTAGAWNINSALSLTGNMAVSAGTVTGTSNVTLLNGSLSGNGVVSFGGGTVLLARTNTLGGTQPWTFNNLTLGNGTVVGTTTPASTATTTVGGVLTIANAHFLDAGSWSLDLSGTGGVFVETGTFLEDTSTVRYSGTTANVLGTGYYNLLLSSGAGSATYTATGLGINVGNNVTVGGSAASNFTLDTNDTALTVLNDVFVTSNGTLVGSNSATLTVAGSWDNNGTFTASAGTVRFTGSGTETVAAGASSFATLRFSGTGSYTVSEHATATVAAVLTNLSGFTLTSGQTLAVSGTFNNYLSGGATTWTGSTLALSGGGTYLINGATSTDTYGTIAISGNTQVRTWNSDAAAVVAGTGSSLYSMDHANVAGDLYVFGDYLKQSGTDFWSFATDFDGTALGGGARKVDVFFENGATARYLGTSQLSVLGSASASTTLQNQGSGTYALTVGGTASTTMNYYEVFDTTTAGLTFTGSAQVQNLSYGYFEVGQTGGSAMTVGGTALNSSPARTFTLNTFATSTGVSSATNVTATGTSVSSWRFTNHSGSIDGEAYDSDPDGDPGYIVWDNSAASITVSGRVYSDQGSTVSANCDGLTSNVVVRVAGLTSYTSTCNAGTGQYSVSGVTYSPGDSIVVYLDGEAVGAAAVTADPVSNINNMDIYERRVIVRHEGVSPLTIDDMAAWDSSDDADIPFTAVNGSPDTLSLPANYKLLVWTGKNFTPGGNVTVSGGGAGADYDGTVELQNSAAWTSAGTQVHTIGGSLISGSGATWTAGNSTTTFTTTGAARTIDINNGSFYNVAFTGSGSWTITDTLLDVYGFAQSAGTLTLPTGTTTVSASFNATGGSFTQNGPFVFDGVGTHVIRFDGSTAGAMYVTGAGTFTMTDTNATSTGALIKTAGSLTLPTGVLALGGGFENNAGTVTSSNGRIVLTTAGSANLRAGGSNLGSVTVAGGGAFTMRDSSLTLTGSLTINGGSLTLATGTLAIAGSFTVPSGSFNNATGTILFNSTDTGETINPGTSPFYNVVFANASGGWTIAANATTTNNFTLTTAASFTQQTGTTLSVGGVFTNSVGGSATTWTGSTLRLVSGSEYAANLKTNPGDRYQTLVLGANTDVRIWNSAATTTTVALNASLYSQDHAASDGALNIYGDFNIGTTTEYWSYATDFDGVALGGSSRDVTVSLAANATTTLSGGTLNIVGTLGNETTITNQGSGTYALRVTDGTFNAAYYAFRNLNAAGLVLSGTPVISSLANGDFELAVNSGTLISLSSTTLNANASLVIPDVRFATTSAITGFNVTLTGVTSNAWTFVDHIGNLDGEAFDVDGVTACGSVRFDDSACLITQQVHYRWRNDDGGIGVPSSEWFDGSWDKRQRVRVENNDATDYANAVVELTIPYDADMQVDFDDLRFTDASGTTSVPFWTERFTASTEATVWVQVPDLQGNDTANIFMYYGNAGASSVSSSTATFIAADDFEDGNITEYTGGTGLFTVDGSFAFGGSNGLDNTGDEANFSTPGIARFDQTVSQGETIRFMQYIDTTAGSGDETCTLFAVQSPITANDNYAVCLEQYNTDRVSIVKDAINTDGTGTLLASTTITYTTGWHEVVIDWASGGAIDVTVNYAGSQVANVSTSDSTYTSGGYGFAYWFNYGGWDSFISRPLVTTEPTVYFGAEQGDGGASWAAALDTVAASFELGDIARLRVLVENSGLTVTGKEYQLEYAEQGAAPSCEAVTGGSYAIVPPQSTCGTSPVCMQSSTFVTDGEATTDLLAEARGTFTLGELTEDPSNIADPLTIDQDEYTELEYAITPTANVVDQNLCFRVTDQGTPLDTYLRVAKLQLRFAPVISGITFNDGDPISLLPGTTTRVYATATVTDLNGYADFSSGYATSTMYPTTGSAACTADNNNCYISNNSNRCSYSSCSGNSCVLSCYADFFFHAEATDESGFDWVAFFEVEDAASEYDFDTSSGIDVQTLRALDVTQSIAYTAVAAGSSTAASNATTSVQNLGNIAIDVNVEGSDMSDGYSSTIPVANQKLATTSFNYTACVSCSTLTATGTLVEVDLAKPTVATPPVSDVIYWGIAIPFGASSAPHTGSNIFYAVDDN